MGETKVKITLVNEFDRLAAQRGFIKKEEVRRAEVEAVVDTGRIPLSYRKPCGCGWGWIFSGKALLCLPEK